LRLVLFTHPEFLGSNSQPRFARMLLDAYRARGHEAVLRQPKSRLRRLINRGPLAKWAGYVDQYLLFPIDIRSAVRRDPADTLYVFCDQALGPWMPLLTHRPHVVHSLDLLALRSALGEFADHTTSWTGKLYQRYIRRGFSKARHFICISSRTREDLLRVGQVAPLTCEVVYLGLNHAYRPLAAAESRAALREAGIAAPAGGFLLHVGGGQWYKNTAGVLALYRRLIEHRTREARPLPALLMVSPPPGAAQQTQIDALPLGARVTFVPGVSAEGLRALYSAAQALLFPSLAEGFGWPIAEAMACGCPVVTTCEAPMTEVGGPHATYLPRLASPAQLDAWSTAAAQVVVELLDRPLPERERAAAAAREWVRRYDPQRAIERYLDIYDRVLTSSVAGLAGRTA
jgi:glycosyltransferase involved in cell wall biosynthesis